MRSPINFTDLFYVEFITEVGMVTYREVDRKYHHNKTIQQVLISAETEEEEGRHYQEAIER